MSQCLRERENSWIHNKSQCGLFWVETYPPFKFNGKSFCVILLTNQPAKKTERVKHELFAIGYWFIVQVGDIGHPLYIHMYFVDICM